jgi:hypothetical protein
MSVRRVQLRRGTSAENNAFTGAIGEITIDTTKNTIRVHDGITLGGTETTLPTLSNIAPTASVDFNNQKIINVSDPTNPQDVATKAYVDSGGGIEIGELVDVTTAGEADAHMLIWVAAENQWKNFAVSGDISIDSTGVVSITSESIVNGDIVDGTIANVKLVNDSVTIGSTEIDLGATSTTLSGMTGIDFTNSDASIGASMTDDGGGTPTILTLGGAGSQVNVTNHLVVGGNLTVQGTTSTVNSTSVAVADRVVELNKDLGANPNDNDLGLFLNRGNEADALILWDEGEGAFVLATHSGAVDASTLDYSAEAGLALAELQLATLSASTNVTSSGTLDVTGISTLTGLLNANGGIAVDTNTFTVAGDGSGNTYVLGTFQADGLSTLASGSAIGDLTLADGSITSDSGAISFGDENLSTTGTLSVDGASTFSENVTIDNQKTLKIEKGATHQIILNSDVEGDNTPANASIAVALSSVPAYATITWDQATTTWQLSNNASVATDLTIGQDLILTRNLIITDSSTEGITFRHDEVAGANETLIRVDRGATYSTITWDESSAYFSMSHGLNVVSAITQGPVDGPANFEVSSTGVITTDSDGHRLAGLTFSGTTIEAVTDGAGISFGDEDVSTTGNLSATDITSTGDMSLNTATFSGLLQANGGIAVDTNAFTVAGDGSGNTSVGGTLDVTGDLDVNSNFIVTAATGNTSISGVVTATSQGHTLADFTVNNGSITSATQIISLGANDLSTTGDLSSTDVTSTGVATLATTNIGGETTITNASLIVENAANEDKFVVTSAGVTTIHGDTTLKSSLYLESTATSGITFRSETGAGADGNADIINIIKGSEGTATLGWIAATDTLNFTDNVTLAGTLGVTGTTTMGVVNLSGLLSADGGVDVNGFLTINSANGNLITSGTADLGATTVDSLSVSEGDITNVGSLSVDTIQSDNGTNFTIDLDDNQANSLVISENGTAYQTFVTTDAGEKVVFGKLIEAPVSSKIANLTITNNTITSAGGSLSLNGANLSTTGTADLGATTVDSLNVSNGGITNAGAVSSVTDIALDSISANGNDTITLDLADNIANAFLVVDDLGGGNQTNYININTTQGSELITLNQATTVEGLLSPDGGVDVNGSLFTVSGTTGTIATKGSINSDGTLTLDDTDGVTSPDLLVKKHTDHSTTFQVLGETGNTAVGGTLTVTGNTSLNGATTTIQGTTTIVDTLNVNSGAQNVFVVDGATGNTTIQGTLSVTGVTSLSSNLDLNANNILDVTTLDVGTIQAQGTTLTIDLDDNQASALVISENGTAYQTFVTTDAGEKVVFAKLIEAPVSSKIANLTITDNTITSAGGSLGLNGANLSTTGTADLGATTVDSLNVSNGGITQTGSISGVTDIAVDTISANGGDVIKLDLEDNLALAFEIVDDLGGGNETSYLKINTTQGSEEVTLPQDTTVEGLLTASGSLTASSILSNGNVTLNDTTNTTSPNLVVKEHTANTTTFQVLGATGNTSISGTLNVDGTTTLNSEVTVANTNLVVEDNLNAENFKVLPSGNTTIEGTLDVNSQVTLTANLDLSDTNITDVNTLSVDVIQSPADASSFDISLDATSATALEIKQGATAYQTFNTTTERVVFGKPTTAPNGSIIAGLSVTNDAVTTTNGTLSLGTDNLTSTGALTIGSGDGNTSIDANQGNLVNVGDVSLDTISSAASTVQVLMDDNVAGSFEIKEATNSYIKVDTTDGSELVTFGQNVQFNGTASFTNGAIGLDGGNVVVNESGSDHDFRVEGTTQTHLLFSDASTNRLGVNNATPSVQLDVVGDTLITGATSLVGAVTQSAGSVAFNNSNGNFDFQVKGGSENNLLYADASADRIGIGTNTPNSLLDVRGAVEFTSTLDVTGLVTLDGSLNLTTNSTDGLTFRSEIVAGDGGADQNVISVNMGDVGGSQAVISWDASESHFNITQGLNSEANFTVGANDGAKVLVVDSTNGDTELSGVLSIKSSDLAGDANVQSAILLLNSDATAVGTERDARVEVERGTATNSYLLWDESEDQWSVSNALNSLGNLTVATNKFSVNATSGNTSVAGTLGVTSTITATAQGHTIADFTINNGEITTATGTLDLGTDDLTTTGSITCTNMTVNGTLTTINSTDLEITDSVIRLNKGVEGQANGRDIGIIMERGTDGNDGIFFFDEGEDIFKLGLTTVAATATDFGDPSTWGDLKIGTLTTTSTITSSGVVNANGGIAIDTTAFTIDGADYSLFTTGKATIQKTDANAFLVEDGAGNDYFNIDTTNDLVTITTALFEPNAGIDVGASVFAVSETGVTSILNTLNVTTGSTAAFVVEQANGTDVFNVDTTNSITSVTGQLKSNDLRPLSATTNTFKVRMTDNVANGLEIVDLGGASYMTFASTNGSEGITISQNTSMTGTLSVTGVATLESDLYIESTHTKGIFFNSEGGAVAGADATLITIEQGTDSLTDVILAWDVSDSAINLNGEASLHLQGITGSNALTIGGATSGSANVTVTTAGAMTLASSVSTTEININELTDRDADGMIFRLADTQASALIIKQGTVGENYMTFNTTDLKVVHHQVTDFSSAVNVTGVTTLSDTLALTKSVADTGVVFNSNRSGSDTPNGTDFDALLLHVENGGALGAVDAYLRWDDDQSSFVVEGGKLHSRTDLSVGSTIGTKTFVVTASTGALDLESTITAASNIKTEAGVVQVDTPSLGAITFNSDNTAELDGHNFGLTVSRPSAGTDAIFYWDETNNVWQFNNAGNVQVQNSLVVDSDQANEVVISAGSITTANNSGLSFGSDSLTTSGNVSTTGSGTLTVAGTTTFSDSVTLATTKTLTLNQGVVDAAADVDATIIVDRGTDSDVFLRWDEGDDRWKITNNGTDIYNVVHENDNLLALTFKTYSGGTTYNHTVKQNANTLTMQGTNEQVQITYSNGVATFALPNTVTIPGDLNVSAITSLGSVLRIADPLIFLGQSVVAQKDSGFYLLYRNDLLSQRFAGLTFQPGNDERWVLFSNNSTLSAAGADESVPATDSELALLELATLRGGLATGTDTAGSDLTLSGGLSTGTGDGGSILFKTAPAGGASNSTSNASETALTIDSDKKAVFEGEVEAKRSGAAYSVVTTKASEGARYECASVADTDTLSAPAAIENKHAYFINNGGTAGSLTLFALSGSTYDGYEVLVVNQGTNTITVNAAATQTINGASSKDIPASGSLTIIAFGTAWYIK